MKRDGCAQLGYQTTETAAQYRVPMLQSSPHKDILPGAPLVPTHYITSRTPVTVQKYSSLLLL